MEAQNTPKFLTEYLAEEIADLKEVGQYDNKFVQDITDRLLAKLEGLQMAVVSVDRK
jgi:hypothetical protein